jgi:glucose dehydrogenase
MLIDPSKTTTWKDGKVQPVGADSSLKTWQEGSVENRRRTTWGWYSYDKALNLVYLRHGQPEHLESGPAARRQQMVDVDLGSRRGYRQG